MSVRRIVVNSKVAGSSSSPSSLNLKKSAASPPSTVVAEPLQTPSSLKSPPTTSSFNTVSSLEDITFLKAENTRLEAELQASVDNLLIVVDEVKFLEDEMESKKKEVASLKAQIVILTDNSTVTLSKAQAEQTSIINVHNDLKKQIQDLTDEKSKWNSAEARLKDNLKALEIQLTQEKRKRSELQNDRKILVEHLKSTQPDTDVSKLLGHSLDDDVVVAVVPEGASLSLESLLDLPPFTSDIDGLKRQLFEAHRKLESLHSEYKTLQQDVNHSHDVIATVSNESDTQVSKWEQTNKELTKEKDALQQTIEIMKKESIKLEQIAASTDKFLKDAQARNSELERTIAVKDEDIKAKIGLLEEAERDKDVVRQLEQLLKKAREQLLALQSDNNTLRGSLNEFDQVMQERDDLRQQLNDFKSEKDALAVKLTAVAQQYDDEFSKMLQDKEKLTKDLAKASEDKQEIDELKKKMEGEIAALTKSNTQLLQNLEKVQNDKISLERSSTHTAEELLMTREELRKVVAHNNSFLRSIASVRSTNESKTELEDLRTQLGDALTLLHTTEQELFENKQAAMKFKIQLEEAQRQPSIPPSAPLAPSAASAPAPPTEGPKKLIPGRLAPIPPPGPGASPTSPAPTSPSPNTLSPSPQSPPPTQTTTTTTTARISDAHATLGAEDLKRLLDEERWKLEEAIRESSDMALKLRETEELLRKENAIVLQRLEKALLASQQVGDTQAKASKENEDLAMRLAESERALEEKVRELEYVRKSNSAPSAPMPPMLKSAKMPGIPKPNLPPQEHEKEPEDAKEKGDDLNFDFDAEADSIIASMGLPPGLPPPAASAPSLKPSMLFKKKPAQPPQPPTSPQPSSPPPTLATTPPPPSSTIPPPAPKPAQAVVPVPLGIPAQYSSGPSSPSSFSYSELTESERQAKELENVIANLRKDLSEEKAKYDRLTVEKQGLAKDITRLQHALDDQEKMKSSAALLNSDQMKKVDAENGELKLKLEAAQKEIAEYRKKLEEAQERFNLAKENLMFMQQMRRSKTDDKEPEKEKDREREKSRDRRGREKSRGRERERKERSRGRGTSKGKEKGKDWDSASDGEREGDEDVRPKSRNDDNWQARNEESWQALERIKEVERARERAMARMRDEERERERDLERIKDREWELEKERAREREKERQSERVKERDRDKERDKEREREREKDREWEREKEDKDRSEKGDKERSQKEESGRKEKRPMQMSDLHEKEDQHYKDIFYNQVVERLESELSSLQKENDHLRSTLFSNSDANIQKKFATLIDENEMLKREFSARENERNALTQELDSLRLQLQDLITEREALAEQFGKVYKETVDRLENEVKQANDLARQSISLNESGGHSTMDEMHLKLNNMALHTKVHTLEQQIETLTLECQKVNTAKGELEVKLREQQQQLRELQREKSASAEALALKTLDLEKKILECERSGRELDKKKRECEKLREEVDRKVQEVEKLQREVTKLHEELFAEKSRMAETEKTKMGLDSKLRDSERNANELERWKNTLQLEVEKTREGKSGISQELHEAQASVERLLKDNLELERKLFEKEQALKEATSKLTNHQADIEKMNAITFEAYSNDSGLPSLKQRTAELQASRTNSRLQEQLKNVTSERDGLHTKIRDLKQELKDTSKKSPGLYSSKANTVESVTQALEMKLNEAHRKLQQVEQENSDLHHLLVDSQVSLNEYALDVEEQLLHYTPNYSTHQSSSSYMRPHTPLTLHTLSHPSHNSHSSSRNSHSSPTLYTPPSTRSSHGDSFLARTLSRNS